MANKSILLAYSGGLDTSAIIPWLRENHPGVKVIAYCADLGDGPDQDSLAKRADALGADKFIFEDLKEKFVAEYIWRLLRSGGLYQQEYLLGTAIARPLIAERCAHFALELGCDALAHGATGKGNDQIRFEQTWTYLAPQLEILTPWKVWDFKGRSDLLEYLKSYPIELEAQNKRFSVDENMLHRSCEGDVLEEIDKPYNPDEVLKRVKLNGQSETRLELTFERGMLTAIDGKTMPAQQLLTTLNEIGGQHGIGIVDLVEERTNGIKSRGIYETPGGSLIYRGLKALRDICQDKITVNLQQKLGIEYANLVYEGLWHSPGRLALESFFEQANTAVTGKVQLLLKGHQILVQGRQSEYSLYDKELVSFESDAAGINAAAVGFCKTLTLTQHKNGLQQQKLDKSR